MFPPPLLGQLLWCMELADALKCELRPVIHKSAILMKMLNFKPESIMLFFSNYNMADRNLDNIRVRGR